MTIDRHTRENAEDPAALGQFIPDRVTVHRCPCSTESSALAPADRQGRIVADPDWGEHQTVTCGRCGRYGQLDPDDPDNGVVAVLGVAPLPAGCGDCGAERGDPCREPFCPGQDVLHPDLDTIPAQRGTGGDPATEPVVYSAAALRAGVPSTARLWRYWASQVLDPGSRGHGALRSAAQATSEARRLRRGLRRGPATIRGEADVDDGDIEELLEFLGGRGGPGDQQQALFALRLTQGWGDSVAAQLLDAAAIWRAAGPAPF